MHPVDPVRVQSLHSVHDGADGPLVGEDPDLGSTGTSRSQGFRSRRGLVTGLDEEVGWEQALRLLLEEHHRIPVVDVRRLQEAQLVLT